MPKFSLEKIIRADREKVFEIFSNYDSYQKRFSEHYPSIRVRSVRNNVAVVEEHLNFDNEEFVIMAKHVSEKPKLHEIFIIGGDAKGSYIKQQFVQLGEKTKVVVDVDLKIKGKQKIMSLFRKNNFEENYSKILDDFVKTAEN